MDSKPCAYGAKWANKSPERRSKSEEQQTARKLVIEWEEGLRKMLRNRS